MLAWNTILILLLIFWPNDILQCFTLYKLGFELHSKFCHPILLQLPHHPAPDSSVAMNVCVCVCVCVLANKFYIDIPIESFSVNVFNV